MRLLLIALCLVGCGKKSEQPAGAGSAPVGSAAGSAATAAGSASVSAPGSAGSGSAEAVPADAAVATAPADAPAVAQICCCESTGDATHYTIEGDASACTADDMRGECVDLKECELEKAPQVLAVGTAVTVEPGGLLAIWPTKEAKAFGATEIKPAGANATVRTNDSNGPDAWKKQGSIPTAPGPLTITAQADGTALVSNGKTTWVLDQQYRYGAITFKKRK